jgi:hypothetical protein
MRHRGRRALRIWKNRATDLAAFSNAAGEGLAAPSAITSRALGVAEEGNRKAVETTLAAYRRLLVFDRRNGFCRKR